MVMYTLSTSVTPRGSAIIVPERNMLVEERKYVTVSVHPERGYKFLGWSINGHSIKADTPPNTEVFIGFNVRAQIISNYSVKIPMMGNVTVLAQFEKQRSADIYELTLFAQPREGGTTEPIPPGIRGKYPRGKKVKIRAIPNPGFDFIKWIINNPRQPEKTTPEAEVRVSLPNTIATAVFARQGEMRKGYLIVDSEPMQGIGIEVRHENDLSSSLPGNTQAIFNTTPLVGKDIYIIVPKAVQSEQKPYFLDKFEGCVKLDINEPQYSTIKNKIDDSENFEIGVLKLPEEGAKVIVHYRPGGTIQHEDRGRWKSSYEMGVVPYAKARGAIGNKIIETFGKYKRGRQAGRFVRQAEELGIGALGGLGAKASRTKILGKRWFGHGAMPKNPALQAAKNKGLRMLNGAAKKWYSTKVKPEIKEAKKKAEEIRKKRNQFQRALDKAMGWFKKTGNKQKAAGALDPIGVMGGDIGAIAGSAKNKISSATDELVIEVIKEQHEEIEKYTENEIRKIDEKMNDLSKQLEDYLVERGEAIGKSLSRIYRFGLNGPEEQELISYLKGEASPDVAMKFMTRGRTWLHAIERTMQYTELGAKTLSAGYENLREQVIDFFTGPWILGAVLLLILWFVSVVYLPPALRVYANGWAGIVALFAMIIKPGEETLFLEALVGGAIIGFSSFIFIFGFFNLFELSMTLGGWTIFFIIFVSFLGVFELYQIRGFGAVKIVAIIFIIFGYITLGPYAAYAQLAVGEVKAPVLIGFAYLKQGIKDVWLMATNPSEWYAQQQLRNVRPEMALSYPKGVEITYLRPMPDSVPAGERFSLAMVYENQGTQIARNVTATATCLKNCHIATSTTQTATDSGGRARGGVTGLAVGDHCYDDKDCDLGTICIDDECIEGCYDDNDCQYGFICKISETELYGSCIEGCRNDNDCDINHVCVNDYCTPGCYDNNDCEAGFICRKTENDDIGDCEPDSGNTATTIDASSTTLTTANSKTETSIDGDSTARGRNRGGVDTGSSNKALQIGNNAQTKKTGSLDLSEGDNVEFGPFVADKKPREFAKVQATVDYVYDTASSLKVTIMDNQEINNQFRKGMRFQPVQAIGKPGPGMVSVNVGPQPLRDNNPSKQLLVSVINNRLNIEEDDFSAVVLDTNTEFIIKIDKSIAEFVGQPSCTSSFLRYTGTSVHENQYWQFYKIAKQVKIEPIETGKIFSFFCKIKLKDIDISKTGLFTVQMKNYHFRISQTKNIIITEPLGVGEEIVTEQTGHGGVQPGTSGGTGAEDPLQGWRIEGCSDNLHCLFRMTPTDDVFLWLEAYENGKYYIGGTYRKNLTQNNLHHEYASSRLDCKFSWTEVVPIVGGTEVAAVLENIGDKADCDVFDEPGPDPGFGDDFRLVLDNIDKENKTIKIIVNRLYQ